MADDTTTEPVEDLEQQQEDEEGGPVKSFLEHLEDLRWVLIKSVVALSLAILVCLIGGPQVVQVLKWPLQRTRVSFPGTNQVVTAYAGTNKLGTFRLDSTEQKSFDLGTNRFVSVELFPTTIGSNRVLSWRVKDDPRAAEEAQHMQIELMNLGPASGFYVAFQVALYAGMVISSPFIFYFVAAFVFPALRMKERYYVYRGLGFGIGLFFTGVAFCYFILMPVALAASQHYSEWLGFSAYQWKADEYISFVSKFMLGMGVGFEMPVVLLTLVKIGVLNYRMLSSFRRYMIVVNLILGAVLTTPEVITQIIMFVPLQGLYEITIWIAYYWEKKEKRRLQAEEAGSSGTAD